jgi:ankyrin repeat protein
MIKLFKSLYLDVAKTAIITYEKIYMMYKNYLHRSLLLSFLLATYSWNSYSCESSYVADLKQLINYSQQAKDLYTKELSTDIETQFSTILTKERAENLANIIQLELEWENNSFYSLSYIIDQNKMHDQYKIHLDEKIFANPHYNRLAHCLLCFKQSQPPASSLITACRTISMGKAFLLLAHGISCNTQNENGSTPLMIACDSALIELIRELRNQPDIDCNMKDNRGKTALMRACMRESLQREVLQELELFPNIDPNVTDNDGYTALRYAELFSQSPRSIETLLTFKSINPNIRDKWGKTILLYACSQRKSNLVHTLLACNTIDANLKDNAGNTPLMAACQQKDSVEIVKALIAKKVDLNQRNSKNQTALDLAYHCNRIEIMEILFATPGIEYSFLRHKFPFYWKKFLHTPYLSITCTILSFLALTLFAYRHTKSSISLLPM